MHGIPIEQHLDLFFVFRVIPGRFKEMSPCQGKMTPNRSNPLYIRQMQELIFPRARLRRIKNPTTVLSGLFDRDTVSNVCLRRQPSGFNISIEPVLYCNVGVEKVCNASKRHVSRAF